MAWDATVPDTLAKSHLSSTSVNPGAAANSAADAKRVKYSALASHLFIPIAVETLGAWDSEGMRFIGELGRRLTLKSGEQRETTFLFQRLSVAIQRGNAISCMGSMPKPTDENN